MGILPSDEHYHRCSCESYGIEPNEISLSLIGISSKLLHYHGIELILISIQQTIGNIIYSFLSSQNINVMIRIIFLEKIIDFLKRLRTLPIHIESHSHNSQISVNVPLFQSFVSLLQFNLVLSYFLKTGIIICKLIDDAIEIKSL